MLNTLRIDKEPKYDIIDKGFTLTKEQKMFLVYGLLRRALTFVFAMLIGIALFIEYPMLLKWILSENQSLIQWTIEEGGRLLILSEERIAQTEIAVSQLSFQHMLLMAELLFVPSIVLSILRYLFRRRN